MFKKTTATRETFALTLDPRAPLEQQIEPGKYKYVNPDITPENFRLTVPAGAREVVLLDPRGYVSSEEMIRRMKADGFKPATIDDALALGARFPERQRENPIVFLGSVWRDADGYRRVPVLDGWHGERGLSLGWFDLDWRGSYRFAAVRES